MTRRRISHCACALAPGMPLLGKTTHDISATDAMWTFFAAHPLP
jgi:poly(3-hydroxybutyrate) depolymerase